MLAKLIEWIVIKCRRLFSKARKGNERTRRDLKTKCPFPEPLHLLESADCLGRRVRERQTSAWKLMVEFVLFSKIVDHEMNVLHDERYTPALKEANGVDLNIGLMPPVCVKQIADNHKFWGLPFSSSTQDSDYARTGRSVGGLLISQTKSFDISYDANDCKRNEGAPKNPYDYTRSTGGGCNGTAALVSSCGVAFAIGISQSFSICISSAYCGVFCHQFSAEVFNYLEEQQQDGEAQRVVSFGPVVRYAADLKILFRAMPFKSPLFKNLQVNEEVKTEELNYYFLFPLATCPWSRDVSERILALVHFLEDQTSGHVFGLKMQVGSGITFLNMPVEDIVRTDKFPRHLESQFLRDVAFSVTKTKCIVRKLRFTYILSKAREVVSALFLIKKNKSKDEEVRKLVADFRRQIAEKLSGNSVLIIPINGCCAPKLHEPGNVDDAILSALFEGLPATAVPIGLDKQNLPIGIQVIGAPLNDRLCIAVAENLEVPFGGWFAPFIRN